MKEVNGHSLNGLPKGWQRVKLGEIISVSSGKGIKVNELKGGPYTVYGGNGITGYHNAYFVEEPKLIIGRVGVKCGVTHVTKPKAWVSDNALIVEPKIKDFNLKFFQLKLGYENLNKLSVSTAQPVISGSKIYSHEISYPPISIQNQIVNKIEELFSELDKSIEQLKTAQQQLKVYRQSVLKWAFDGRLTNEEVKEGKLPEGWHINNLEELGDKDYPFSYGVLKPGAYYPNGVLLIKSQHIRNLYISNNIEFRISKELDKEFKRTRIKGGEILLNLVGASIGRCAIAPEYLKGANVSRAVAVLTIDKLYSSRYILFFLANFFSEKKIKEITGGSAQSVLNLSTVRKIEVPLCPFKEQMRIVEEIESRLSVADKVEETIVNSLEQAEALRQSILKIGFEGKLC